MRNAEIERLLDLTVAAMSDYTGKPSVACPVCGRAVPQSLLSVHARAMGDDEHGVLQVMTE